MATPIAGRSPISKSTSAMSGLLDPPYELPRVRQPFNASHTSLPRGFTAPLRQVEFRQKFVRKSLLALEIFFQFFKHILGCRHRLSHSRNGIELQVSSAIIACLQISLQISLLISLWTGRKPTHEMICWYFCGMADDDELLAHLNGLKNQN